MKQSQKTKKREPTIALINVVFLMLVFFLIAGTIAPALDQEIALVKTSEIDQSAPPEGLVIHADGSLFSKGSAVSDVQSYLATLTTDDLARITLIPDRDLPAAELLQIGALVKNGGGEKIMIASEREQQ